jgi:hypothetical protein
MSIDVNCPSCGTKLRLAEKFARRGLVCPKCRHEFRLPPSAEAAATAAETKSDATRTASRPAAARQERQQLKPRSIPQQPPALPAISSPGARAGNAPQIQRAPLPSEYWNEVDDLGREPAALPRRMEPRKPAESRKRRVAKKRGGGSDWPFYVLGFVAFGPVIVLVHGLQIWNLLAAKEASPQAVVQGGGANQPGAAAPVKAGNPPADQGEQIQDARIRQPQRLPKDAAPLGNVEGSVKSPVPDFLPPAQIAAAPERQALPPRFAPGGRFPNRPVSPFLGRPNRAAEIMKREMERSRERMKASREQLAAIEKQKNDAQLAMRPEGGGLRGEPINPVPSPAPVQAANPDPLNPGAVNRGAVNRDVVNLGAANPAAAAPNGKSVDSPRPLDRYLSRDSQAVFVIVMLLWYLAMIVYLAAGVGATFAKAGKPRLGVLIPFYNVVILFNIAGLSLWWALLILVPFVNLVVVLLVGINIAQNFGKSTAFGVGLAFLGPIFYPVLGFGSARYRPPRTAFASECY